MPGVPQQTLLFPEDEEKRRRAHTFGTPEFWQNYREYIRSAAWRKLRRQVLARAGGRCEVCGPCHDEADRRRERKNRQKFEEACEEGRYNAARSTYLENKYGEVWPLHYWHDPDAYDDEFDEWLDRKREEQYDRYR